MSFLENKSEFSNPEEVIIKLRVGHFLKLAVTVTKWGAERLENK